MIMIDSIELDTEPLQPRLKHLIIPFKGHTPREHI